VVEVSIWPDPFPPFLHRDTLPGHFGSGGFSGRVLLVCPTSHGGPFRSSAYVLEFTDEFPTAKTATLGGIGISQVPAQGPRYWHVAWHGGLYDPRNSGTPSRYRCPPDGGPSAFSLQTVGRHGVKFLTRSNKPGRDNVPLSNRCRTGALNYSGPHDSGPSCGSLVHFVMDFCITTTPPPVFKAGAQRRKNTTIDRFDEEYTPGRGPAGRQSTSRKGGGREGGRSILVRERAAALGRKKQVWEQALTRSPRRIGASGRPIWKVGWGITGYRLETGELTWVKETAHAAGGKQGSDGEPNRSKRAWSTRRYPVGKTRSIWWRQRA